MNVAVLAEELETLPIEGIGYIAIPVADPARAAEFYGLTLGYEAVGHNLLPHCGRHEVLRAGAGQWLVLVAQDERLDLRDSGVHHAFRVTRAQRDAVAAKLAAAGVEVLTYKEDRPAEAEDNFYFFDPDGNRLQLVVSAASGIDHTAIQSADVLRGEIFYGNILGWPVEHRVGWRTGDYVRARKWAAGEEDMAPGTRRLDQRYTVMVNRKTVARANMQLFFTAGASTFGVYLANKHYQEPPEEQSIGLPRTAFSLPQGGLEKVAQRLAANGQRFAGPVTHPAASPIHESLYVRDPSGNFLEFFTARRP
ncbi:MAG TPA: VOC family protein [Alphaproteobacteria bacterium]|jgi:catechol 2,3-dioxygenase-like lactoylglutathione lyase family enzyme